MPSPAGGSAPPGLGELGALLLARLGPQGWWPAETAAEMIVGAVLTQGVAWENAARAIARLRAAGLLEFAALATASPEALAPLIRSAGYFNVKARKLVAVARHVTEAGGVSGLARVAPGPVREGLLGVFGVGPETADAILCYALGRPALVADAYARRVLARIGCLPPQLAASYAAAQAWLQPCLPQGADAAWLGEFHALLVAVGKDWCRPRAPRCSGCPALPLCVYGRGRPVPGGGAESMGGAESN